ncbi:major capsid protein [Luteimonas sp. MJ250]|uniref:major capsid protein n=1 Tax=Luteimonas sp. MJ250 TaxID=3129236 RepID=UPI0031BAF78B
MSTRLSDVIVPEEFTAYVAQNTAQKSALVQSGVMARNAAIEAQLSAGADAFTIPNWNDLGNDEADIVNDDPDDESAPGKIGAARVLVRKAFVAKSWGAMNFASEMAGDNAMNRIRDRSSAYWTRQLQSRLVSTLNGVLARNVAANGGDMRVDITAGTGDAAKFSAGAVIDAAHTLGDSLRDVTAIGMHSDTYAAALKADLIQTIPQSSGGFIQTFRGLAILVDDDMPKVNMAADPETDPAVWAYTSVLFGPGAIAYGFVPPRVAAGTAIEYREAAGNGGGQEILHNRFNLALQPVGFSWVETAVAAESPTIAELANAANWNRVYERKNIPLAFLHHKL